MNKSFKKIKDSKVIISELMLPSRANFNNKIHGWVYIIFDGSNRLCLCLKAQ